MTGQQVFDAWNDPEITDIYEAAVLMAIADEADERGFSRPRIEDICRKARCKKRSVEIQIKALKEKGKITVTTRKGTSNEYHIMGRTTCAPTRAPHAPLPAHDVHLLPAPNAPHSISSIKDLGIKGLNNAVTGKPPEPPIPGKINIPVRCFDPDEPDSITKDKKGKRRLSHECPENWPVMKSLRTAAHAGPGEDDARIGREAKLIRKCEPNWSPDEIARFIIAQFVVKSGYWFSAPHAFGKRVDYYPIVTQVRQHWTKAKEWVRRKPAQSKAYEEA